MAWVCATLTSSWGSPPVYQLTSLASQPSDLSTCSYLITTGSDYSVLAAQVANAPSLESLVAQVENLQALVSNLPSVEAPPFDASLAAQYWAFAFVIVLTFWVISHVAGVILKPVRRG